MSFAEVNPTKDSMLSYMECYKLSLQMPDDAPFTVPSWFLRQILEDYLSRKDLKDITKEVTLI